MPASTFRQPPRQSRPRSHRGLVVAVLVAAVAVVGGGAFVLLGGLGGPEPRDGLEDFAAAWTGGDDAAAGAATTSPGAAAAALRANRRGLDGGSVRVSVAGVTKVGDDAARGRLRVVWRVPAFGRFA